MQFAFSFPGSKYPEAVHKECWVSVQSERYIDSELVQNGTVIAYIDQMLVFVQTIFYELQ